MSKQKPVIKYLNKYTLRVKNIREYKNKYDGTAILISIEGHGTALNSFLYQFTTGKTLKNLKVTLDYYENGSSKYILVFHVLHRNNKRRNSFFKKNLLFLKRV